MILRILFALLLMCSPVMAGNVPMLGGGATTTCTEYASQATTGDYWAIGSTTNNIYVGQADYTPAVSGEICDIAINVFNLIGNVSSYQYRFEIYNMDGTSLGSDPSGVCVSEAKTISSTGSIHFGGMSCVVLSSGSYGIVLTRTDHSYSALNYIQVRTSATNTTFSGNFHEYASGKTETNSRTQDLVVTLSTKQ